MSENPNVPTSRLRKHSGADEKSIVQAALDDGLITFQSLNDALEEFERSYLLRLLERTDGNIAQAAKLAKRHRTDLYKLLKRHHVDRESFKTSN